MITNITRFSDLAEDVREAYAGPLDRGTIRKFTGFYLGWAALNRDVGRATPVGTMDQLKALSNDFVDTSFGPEFSDYVNRTITEDEAFCGDLLRAAKKISNGIESSNKDGNNGASN